MQARRHWLNGIYMDMNNVSLSQLQELGHKSYNQLHMVSKLSEDNMETWILLANLGPLLLYTII